MEKPIFFRRKKFLLGCNFTAFFVGILFPWVAFKIILWIDTLNIKGISKLIFTGGYSCWVKNNRKGGFLVMGVPFRKDSLQLDYKHQKYSPLLSQTKNTNCGKIRMILKKSNYRLNARS